MQRTRASRHHLLSRFIESVTVSPLLEDLLVESRNWRSAASQGARRPGEAGWNPAPGELEPPPLGALS